MTPKLWRRAAAILAAALLLLPLFVPAAEDEKPLGKLPPDLALVPRDALLFTTIRVSEMAADARVKKLLPLMDHAVRSHEWTTGLKLADVERVTAVVRRIEAQPVVIVRTHKPIDRDAVLKRFNRTSETTLHGKKVLIGMTDGVTPTALHFADERTVIYGMNRADDLAGLLGALAAGGKTHALADELKVAAGKHTLVVAARPELLFRTIDAERRLMEERWEKKRPFPIKDKGMPKGFKEKDRPFIKDGIKDTPRAKDRAIIKDAPPPRPIEGVKEKVGFRVRAVLDDAPPKDGPREMKETPLKLRTIEEITGDGEMRTEAGMLAIVFRPVFSAKRALLTADLGETITAEDRADFAREEDVKDAEVLARMGLYLLREVAPVAWRSGFGLDLKSKPIAELLKQYKDAIRAVEVKADGKLLKGTAKVKLDIAPLLKAVADEAPARTQTNNLKQIGIAFHNYHDAYNHLPPPAICDGRGKPLLSWRVAILPYIDQDKLYRQFKLDEPWDSPHNKKLISKMPKLYHPVVTTGADPTSTATHYQVFTGPNTLFPKPDARTRLTDVFDGLSNTFLVVEAGKAVPWTKPDDIDVSGKELPKLGGQFPGFLHVVFGDGAVRRIKRGADERLLRLFIDPRDGTPLDHDRLKP